MQTLGFESDRVVYTSQLLFSSDWPIKHRGCLTSRLVCAETGLLDYIDYFPQFRGISTIQSDPRKNRREQWMPKKLTRKNKVLNFSWRFCLFPQNKSSKQTTETRQARPQLHFAPKIIKFHLTVLENKLIEVCRLILKKIKKHHLALMYVLLIQRPP